MIKLFSAVQLVKDGMSVNQASAKSSIPKSTLARHFHNSMQSSEYNKTQQATNQFFLLRQ